jgi:ABC-type branched-subunit amino acid transport system substrate-binding protein
MLGLTMDTPLLSTDILRYAVIAHGETEIVSRNLDRSIYRYSYSAAKDRCLRLSATLQPGLSAGDRLGSLAWNIHNNFELPGFEMEGKTFGQYILKNKPDAKIGVLYQNDDYGKDFLTGLKAAIGEGKTKIVAEVAYELTDPTIDSQIVRLKDSGADVLLYFSTPKFTAQGLRKVKEMNWTPLQFLASPTNSVKTVLEPAGFENAQGIITTQFTKQAGDPKWVDDPEVKEYVEFMKKWVPNDNPGDFVALSGYIIAQGIAQALKQCGDDLTRENLLKQATSMRGKHFKMMLPGIQLNTSPDDYAPYQSLRMAIFEGSSWKLIDEASAVGQSPAKK